MIQFINKFNYPRKHKNTVSTIISDRKAALSCLDIPNATNLFDVTEIGIHKKLKPTLKNESPSKIFKSVPIPLTIPPLNKILPTVRINVIESPKTNNGKPAIAKLIPDLV